MKDGNARRGVGLDLSEGEVRSGVGCKRGRKKTKHSVSTPSQRTERRENK